MCTPTSYGSRLSQACHKSPLQVLSATQLRKPVNRSTGPYLELRLNLGDLFGKLSCLAFFVRVTSAPRSSGVWQYAPIISKQPRVAADYLAVGFEQLSLPVARG